MSEAVKLVTAREQAAGEVVDWIEKTLNIAKRNNCCGVAIALVKSDGSVSTTTYGKGNRALLLGAVTDLQYTLAKSGDPE